MTREPIPRHANLRFQLLDMARAERRSRIRKQRFWWSVFFLVLTLVVGIICLWIGA